LVGENEIAIPCSLKIHDEENSGRGTFKWVSVLTVPISQWKLCFFMIAIPICKMAGPVYGKRRKLYARILGKDALSGMMCLKPSSIVGGEKVRCMLSKWMLS